MPDVALVQSGAANGTATPATMTLTGVTAGNLLVCVIAVAGTSPTIATPTGDAWISSNTSLGSAQAIGLFFLLNAGAGSHTPSAVLGGTVTGWIIELFEFSQTGANCAKQGGAITAPSTQAQLPNIFPTVGNTLYNELFVYVVSRLGAVTLTPQNSFVGPLSVWSPSIQPQANVQGLSVDFFWASGLGQGVGQYPSASGLLSSAVNSKNIAAWFNTTASQPGPNGDNIGGQAGILVGSNYQGMVGG